MGEWPDHSSQPTQLIAGDRALCVWSGGLSVLVKKWRKHPRYGCLYGGTWG
jgi:hypothetical protein